MSATRRTKKLHLYLSNLTQQMDAPVIVPIVEENQWQQSLLNLPPFVVETEHVLLVSPHPDDETLGAGAYLAAQAALGVRVEVASVTDGENAYTDNTGLADLRRREQTEALRHLGVTPDRIHRFGMTDSGLDAQGPQLIERLSPLVTARTHILAPWVGDYHPDHIACGWAARWVAQQTGATLSWYFFWTWHRGTPADLSDLDLRVFSFDASLLETKLAALTCHHSQLHRSSGDPILPDSLLGPARRNFEVFARA